MLVMRQLLQLLLTLSATLRWRQGCCQSQIKQARPRERRRDLSALSQDWRELAAMLVDC